MQRRLSNDTHSKALELRYGQIPSGGRKICGGENIMMIVLGHFLIAAAAVIATSAIIGYFLTKLLLRLLQKVDRSIRLYRGKINRSGQNVFAET
jgi:hypothetical protein